MRVFMLIARKEKLLGKFEKFTFGGGLEAKSLCIFLKEIHEIFSFHVPRSAKECFPVFENTPLTLLYPRTMFTEKMKGIRQVFFDEIEKVVTPPHYSTFRTPHL